MLPPPSQYPVPGMLPQQQGPPPVQPGAPPGPGMAQGGGPPPGPGMAQGGGPPSPPQHPAMMLISLIQQNPSIAIPILNMLQQQMAPQRPQQQFAPQQPQLPQGMQPQQPQLF